jgi:hypothetical protein
MREAPPAASDACFGGRAGHDNARHGGERFSESPRTPAEIDIYADGLADMFCAYLKSLDMKF